MTAPDASLYDRAVLDPQNSFGDPELRAARVMTTDSGAPASWGGNFANVYLLESGSRRIALRCFLKELEGQENHYASIAREFNASTSPFAVNFVFLPKGIRINNQWLPVVKMEWIDGQLLDEFTGQNLTKPERFKYLADKYLEMSRSMRAIGIAHGDLNPTNIFVFNRNFKLIDYDAMFVPSLTGSTGGESGLRLYQHPNRHRNHLGAYIDNFSDWIHYTTLLVYSVEPSLFVNAGLKNDYALFQYADYVNPAQSRLFNYLKNHGNPEIRGLALHIERFLGFPVEHVPALDPTKIRTGETVAGAPQQVNPQQLAPQQNAPQQVNPVRLVHEQDVPQPHDPQQSSQQERRKDSQSLSRSLRPRPTAEQPRLGGPGSPPQVSSTGSPIQQQQPLISPLAGTPDTEDQSRPVFSGGLAGISRSNNSGGVNSARTGSAFGANRAGLAAIDRSDSSRTDSSAFGAGLSNNSSEEISATDPRRAGGLGAGLAGGGNSSSGYQSFGGASNSNSGSGEPGRTTAASRSFQHESLMPSVRIIFGATIAVSVLSGVSACLTNLGPKDGATGLNFVGMALSFATVVAWIFAGTQFMMWLNKAYRNLQNGGVFGTKFGATSFMITLFIPIANCIVPYLTMQELTKASKPTEGANSWKTSSSSPLVFCWAFVWSSVWIATGFISYFGMITDAQTTNTMNVVSSVLYVVMILVAAILCGMMVKNISEKQEQKFTRELSEDADRSGGDGAAVLGLLTIIVLGITSLAPNSLMAVVLATSFMAGTEAETAIEQRDYKKAISICEQHKGYSSPFITLRTCEGKAYAGLNDYKKAIEIYDETIKANPDATEVWIERGSAKIDNRNSKDAIVDLNKAIELDKDSSRAFCIRARALIAQEQYPKALKDVEAALKLDSEKAYAHFLKGMILIASNKYEDALPAFEKAAELDAAYPATFYNLGTCYQKLNQPDEAKENFEKAATMYRDSGDEANALDAEKRLKMLGNR